MNLWFFHRQIPVALHIFDLLANSAGPLDFDRFRYRVLACSEEHRAVARAAIAGRCCDAVPLLTTRRGGYMNKGTDSVAVAAPAAKL